MSRKRRFEACLECKDKFGKRLGTPAPKFVVNGNVESETVGFTGVDDWWYGTEKQREYVERVCGVMGVCDE